MPEDKKGYYFYLTKNFNPFVCNVCAVTLIKHSVKKIHCEILVNLYKNMQENRSYKNKISQTDQYKPVSDSRIEINIIRLGTLVIRSI